MSPEPERGLGSLDTAAAVPTAAAPKQAPPPPSTPRAEPGAESKPGICVSILHTGKPVRLSGESPAEFIETISKANISWVNFGVRDVATDGEYVASLMGFSSSLYGLLLRSGLSAYEDLDSEMGLRLPIVRVRELEVEIYPLLILIRKGIVLTIHEEEKVTRMVKFARYADTFMRKIPRDAAYMDKLTMVLMRIINENNERNFDGLRVIEEQGDRLGQFLLKPEAPSTELAPQIYKMKHALITYLDTLWASLDVIQSLRFGDAELISDDEALLGRVGILADDVTRQISLSEHMSEVLASGLEVLQSIYNNQLQKLNNKLAAVVAWLTVLGTAVLVPNTLATAIGAMPDGWPLDTLAYWLVIAGSTAVSTLLAWLWVKRRGLMPSSVE